MNYCVSNEGNILIDTNNTMLETTHLYECTENPSNKYKMSIEGQIFDHSLNNAFIKVNQNYRIYDLNIFIEHNKFDSINCDIYVLHGIQEEIDTNTEINIKVPIDDFGNIYENKTTIKIDEDIYVQDKFYV
jgi:hypothetical protein